jgi:hypothetical protein
MLRANRDGSRLCEAAGGDDLYCLFGSHYDKRVFPSATHRKRLWSNTRSVLLLLRKQQPQRIENCWHAWN